MDIDLLLREANSDREVWRGPLPRHVLDRFIADTHMAAVLAGSLPNDGAAVRVDLVAIEQAQEQVRLRIAVGAGSASFAKAFSVDSLRDDAEVAVTRLLATEVLAKGTYRFSWAPGAPASEGDSRLRCQPLPQRLGRFPERSIWDVNGIAALPACRHPAILLPRRLAQQLVDQARASSEIEVGDCFVVEPFLIQESANCRLALRVIDAVPLGCGTQGERMRLRVTPAALAAVRPDETRGQRCGGLAHSHPFGEKVPPHFLSGEDKMIACGFFWLPFQIQCVIDPRFSEPEDALAAFCWVDAALARVCFTLIDD